MFNALKEIMSSAAKLVFLLIAISACAAFFTGHLSEDNFMILAGAAFTFFFTYKGDNSQPYAGK